MFWSVKKSRSGFNTMKTKVEIQHVFLTQSLAHSIVDLRVFWTMACSLSNEASLRNC